MLVEPGDFRVRAELQAAAAGLGVPLELRPDRHHLCSVEEFAAHASGRKQLRMEYFYRMMRRRYGVLMAAMSPPEAAGTTTPRTG